MDTGRQAKRRKRRGRVREREPEWTRRDWTEFQLFARAGGFQCHFVRPVGSKPLLARPLAARDPWYRSWIAFEGHHVDSRCVIKHGCSRDVGRAREPRRSSGAAYPRAVHVRYADAVSGMLRVPGHTSVHSRAVALSRRPELVRAAQNRERCACQPERTAAPSVAGVDAR